MTEVGTHQMEHAIARCRVLLAAAAMLVVYIDFEAPLLARWVPFINGPFTMDPRLLFAMALFLTYSLVLYFGVDRWIPARAANLTIWVDVLFGVAVATMTEGATGPAFPFFAFAVVASGIRGGHRLAMLVTAVSLGLYMCLILVSVRRGADAFIMRPVYLGITGYLVSYLGQQRLELQEKMRQLEVSQQRHRIARDLHDGYAQALAGINLRLEASRRLLGKNAAAEALSDLTDLQESVNREYDELRRYARELAGVEFKPALDGEGAATQLRVRTDLAGPIELVEHVLDIAREGVRNVRRHAQAKSARIEIEAEPSHVRIQIDDDGVGFDGQVQPWAIASRVKEVGGQMEVATEHRPGAHLLITIPRG